MTNYRTSNGDFSFTNGVDPVFVEIYGTPKWRVNLLVSSIIDSLKRGSLDWNDERAWSDLEMGYNEIKGGK